ncbi:MAG: ABC transporter substrate-binding protein [Rhodoglobus sp.]
MKRSTVVRFGVVALTAPLLLSGCATATNAATTDLGPAKEVRLAYFSNVTHAPALVGLEQGLFEDALGNTALTTQVFSAGPATIEAVSAGAVDAAYIGPSPAINTYLRSGGASAVIVAGATNGGAALVVREGIDDASDLAGMTVATPQLGNTQDVALRSWLADQGLESNTMGGGEVLIQPSDNSDTFTLFSTGKLDGAWVPEPWVSRLILDADAHVLVDEASLWPDGAFPTTVLLVNKKFLVEHPDTVEALIEGHVSAVSWLAANPDSAATVINKRLRAETGKALADDVLARALNKVRFSTDPLAATFPTLADRAVAVNTGIEGELNGIFDLRMLNRALSAADGEPVSAAGLGKE